MNEREDVSVQTNPRRRQDETPVVVFMCLRPFFLSNLSHHAKVEKSKSTYEDQYSIRAAQTRSTIYE